MTRFFSRIVDTFGPQNTVGMIGVVFAAFAGLMLAILLSAVANKWMPLSFMAAWFSGWGLFQSAFCIYWFNSAAGR